MSITTQSQSHDVVEFDEKKMALIRNTFCVNATQQEFEVFMEICKSTQLNPLFKQIYFIKRGDKPTHQTSIDGLRLIADRTKRYVPGRESTYTYDKNGHLLSATSYIKKLAHDGTWHEVAATAIFQEYNAQQGLWKKMPCAMLSKCAEALALRKAFPADMLGLYTKDEMDQADIDTSEHPTIRNSQTVAPEPPEEIITPGEAQDVENILAGEDKQYRDDLLAYYTNKRKLKEPMVNFIGLPRKYLESLLRSFEKRREARSKKQEIVIENSETIDADQIPF
jgi:phage recombination protein Bet